MERRFEGFPCEGGLVVLDTFTGEVNFVPIGGMALAAVPTSISGGEKFRGIAEVSMTDFDKSVCTTYPYPIAKPYSELIAEKDPRQQCKLMVDTFTSVLKLMALQVASEYLRVKDLKDVLVNQTLKRDIQRPLISAWNNVLMQTIPVLEQNNIPFFSPELIRAYEILESKCTDKVFVEKHYEDEQLNMVTKRTPLAKIQALIHYRNSLAHGFNQSRERATKELGIYLPILKDILEEVRYMARYTLWHVASKEDNVEGIRLMGSSPSRQSLKVNRALLDPGISPVFLVNESTLEVLPMFTFLDLEISEGPGIADTGKDIFIFDGNTNSTVIYLSTSSGQHLEKKSRMKHWKELLKSKELELKAISEKDLDLQKIKTMTSIVTDQTIQTLINSGKFIPQVTLKRDDLEIYLDQYFLGDYNAIVIGGESGIGKSTLLADKVCEWTEEGHPVMFYKASALHTPDIGPKFIRDLGLKVNYPEEFLAMVSEIMIQNDKKFMLVIDAINEFSGDVNMLINALEGLVKQAAPYRWFRLIITVRDSSYKRSRAKFGSSVPDRYYSIEVDQAGEKSRSLIIPLNRLNENTVERIYEKYRSYVLKDSEDPNDPGYHMFRPINAYSALDTYGTTAELMKSPLMMRLLLQAFNRKELPSNLSTDSAMQMYLDDVVLEKNNPYETFKARGNFLSGLVKILDKASNDTLKKDLLLEVHSLKVDLMNPQKDSPYVQLLELGVLMEEWEEGECYVRFSFDRLFEFLLAQNHSERATQLYTLKNLLKRSEDFKSMEGALQIILIRLAQNGERKVLMELIDSIDAEEEKSIQLVVGFFKSLYTIDRTLFNVLIESLPENPTRTDLKILSELIKSDLVFETKETEHFLNLMFDIAKTLGDMAYQADALCLLGNHLMAIGESKVALKNYEAALALFEELKDLDGLARTYDLIGNCQLELDPYFISENFYHAEPYDNNNPISLTESSLLEMVPEDHSWLISFNKAMQLNEQINTLESKKRLVHNLIGKALGYDNALKETPVFMFNNMTMLSEEEKSEINLCIEKYLTPLYQDALLITEEIDYKSGASPIYNNLAALEMDRDNHLEALSYLEKGLAIAESLGDSKRLGYFYWNFSICKLNLEQIDVLNYFMLRVKAGEQLKRSGDLQSEIKQLDSFLRPLRNTNFSELFLQNAADFFNEIVTTTIFDLSERWFNSLLTSAHKSSLSGGDRHLITQLMDALFRIPWVNLDRIRKILLDSSLITKLLGIFSLIECDRVVKKYEFSHQDPELLNDFLLLKIETLHAFEREEHKTSEEEFEQMKSGIVLAKQFIEALIQDDWDVFEKLLIIELSPEDEMDRKKLSEKTLEQLSWCRDVNQCKEILSAYKTKVSSYLKEIKKDKEKSQYYRFVPEAVFILEKLILGKKITEKEISECISHFKLSYADESPFVFFYRLVLYLKEQGNTQLMKEIFLKMDEDDLRFPEVWPRTAEMERIREEVFRG